MTEFKEEIRKALEQEGPAILEEIARLVSRICGEVKVVEFMGSRCTLFASGTQGLDFEKITTGHEVYCEYLEKMGSPEASKVQEEHSFWLKKAEYIRKTYF